MEFPDPGRRWRILFIALLLLLGMGGTAVVMKKLAHVGDLREEMDFRKNQGKQ